MTQVYPLRLLFEVDEIKFYIYPVVLKNKDKLILIDSGYPQFLPQLEEAFLENELDIRQLKQLIISNHDHDHMGAARELMEKYPTVAAKCSKEQLPYVLGQKRSQRIVEYEQIGECLTGVCKAENEKFLTLLKNVRPLEQAEIIGDQDKIFDDVVVLETPGHMEGHLSFYVESSHTLICGDMLISEGGILDIACKEFVMDKEKEIESLKKVLPYPIDKIICYHGGEYMSCQLKEELREIIEYGYTE